MTKFIKRIVSSDPFAIIAAGMVQGLLTSLAMEPHGLPTGWVLPWPLFYLAWRFRTSLPMLVLGGFACALFFCMFSFYWVIGLFGVFAGLGPAAAASLFVPFSILFNLHIPAFLALFGLALRSGRAFRPRWLVAGTAALIADYAAPKFFPFCWGNFIAGNRFMVQMADLTGAYGLTPVLFLSSYFFYRAATAAWAERRGLFGSAAWLRRLARPDALARLLPVPVILVLCLSYGAARLKQMAALQRTLPTVRTAIINPDAPPEDAAYVNNAVLEELTTRTIPGLADRAAAYGPLDLVVLPESAVPFMCAEDSPLTRARKKYSPDAELMAQLIAYNHDADVFLNETLYRAVPGESGRKAMTSYNSSVIYWRNGRRGDTYQKRRLLPFGEYLPGENLFKKIGLYKTIRAIMGSSRFSPGPESNLVAYTARERSVPLPAPLTRAALAGIGPRAFETMFPKGRTATPAGRFLPLICYESLFPDHVRSFFSPGRDPDFIVNITQDGWYGDTDETYQHYELARIRAVEMRRALVRAVNDGAAGFVDITGKYITPLAGPVMTAPGHAGFQVWDVPVNRGMTTVYVRWGDWWILLYLLALGVGAVIRSVISHTSRPPVPRRGHGA